MVTLGCIISVLCFFYYRISQVNSYRISLIDQIDKAVKKNLERGELNWKWRYQRLSEVTYHEMVWKFWKPLNSFYKDTSFLN